MSMTSLPSLPGRADDGAWCKTMINYLSLAILAIRAA